VTAGVAAFTLTCATQWSAGTYTVGQVVVYIPAAGTYAGQFRGVWVATGTTTAIPFSDSDVVGTNWQAEPPGSCMPFYDANQTFPLLNTNVFIRATGGSGAWTPVLPSAVSDALHMTFTFAGSTGDYDFRTTYSAVSDAFGGTMLLPNQSAASGTTEFACLTDTGAIIHSTTICAGSYSSFVTTNTNQTISADKVFSSSTDGAVQFTGGSSGGTSQLLGWLGGAGNQQWRINRNGTFDFLILQLHNGDANNGGNITFSADGATGNATVGGTLTLSGSSFIMNGKTCTIVSTVLTCV
jgi:hypothetical protein